MATRIYTDTRIFTQADANNNPPASLALATVSNGDNAIFTVSALYANIAAGGGGVLMSSNGSVQIAGQLYSDGLAIFGNEGPTVTGNGNRVAVLAGGIVSSTSSNAILLKGSDVRVSNAGTIQSNASAAINLTGDSAKVFNETNGFIESAGGPAIQLQGLASRLVNAGTIHSSASANAIVLGGTLSTLINDGRILSEGGGVSLAGNAALTNSGTIESADSAVLLSQPGSYQINNSGTIASSRAYGILALGTEPSLTLNNSGTIGGFFASLVGGGGTDTVINTGTIHGDVFLQGGDDVFDSSTGALAGKIFGAEGNDQITGSDRGGDTLSGDEGDDMLFGLGGDDILIGGIGADDLDGGDGRDTADYSFSFGGVTVDLSNLIAGTGEAAGDVFVSIERVVGSIADDFLYGTSSRDYLVGGDGNDVLDGRGGPDAMRGGTGNDTYYVDDLLDKIVEQRDEGNDLVYSSVSFSLKGQFIETLTLTGGADIDGTGNSQNNVLVGNTGANTLFGAAGDDRISGGSGNDMLYGGEGLDTLKGGSGNDRFVFDTALSASKNLDHITDFSAADDTIVLDSAIFTKAGAAGQLAAGAFALGTAAQDAGDRIIYDQASGTLFYDADGTGTTAKIAFAVLDTHPAITAADLLIV